MRPIKRSFWIVVAAAFLAEAWLWELLQPAIARFARLFNWPWLRPLVARIVDALPPWAVLLIFAVPALLLIPVKLAALWFIATGHPLAGMATFIVAKLIGLSAAVFLFEICQPKLMTMAWFARVYDWIIRTKSWARAQIAPAQAAIRAMRARALGKGGSLSRRFHWLRRRNRPSS